MKTIIKTTLSLILALCMVLPMTVLADYKDVPTKHWAYEYVMRLAEEGIMHGMVEGEYFNKHGEVRAKELLAVLHRMTGEEAYEELIPIKNIEDAWYKEAVLWAVNNSVAMFGFTHYSMSMTSGMFAGFWGKGRIYDKYLNTIADPDAIPGDIRFEIGDNGAETVVTRSDVVVAFYRYTTEILECEVSSKGDMSVYSDSEKFPIDESDGVLYRNSHKMYNFVKKDLVDLYGVDAMTQIWLWAIDAGIIEGYPDGTLRPDATITRAEFAAMLTRFMDYVK